MMLDVLEVYERPYDTKRPVVCLDEKSKQLLKETRIPVKGKPGKPAKADYEYKRNGTANLFVAVEPKRSKREVWVTKRRTKQDYAPFIKHLADEVYKEAEKIVLVQDNLNTHKQEVLIEILGDKEGKRIADKIEWYYTPKHASWLDQAEIEIHGLETQCLNKRIGDIQTMEIEVAACVQRRNNNKVGINWQFTREKAREKFRFCSLTN